MAVSPTPEQGGYDYVNAMERSRNWSLDPEAPEEFDLSNGLPILSLVLALVGLVGNGLVLWLLGFRIRKNPFSVYILNLAVANDLFLCCQFVTPIVDLGTDLYDSSLMTGVMNLRGLSYCVGLSLLSSICTEGCLAVLFPIWYRCHRHKHTSVSVCAMIWALHSLVWLAFFVLCYLQLDDNNCDNTQVFFFVWPLFLTYFLCVSSLTLLLRVQCSSQHPQPPSLYLLMLLNVLIFLIFGVPSMIMEFLTFYHYVLIPFGLPQLLACVNSSANPFIYFFLGIQRHRRRREPIRVLLKRGLVDEQELEMGQRTAHASACRKPHPDTV